MSYTVADAIKVARAEVGYRESGTNKTKFNVWLGTISGYPHGGVGYPWCQSFQSWVASKAGGKANEDYPKTAGCATAVAWFKRKNHWSETPHVGDQVFYGPGGATHVELVVKVTKTTITTVGGNTSGSLSGQYFNGNGVYQKTVSRSSSRIHGYGRPKYDPEAPAKPTYWDVQSTVASRRVRVPWATPLLERGSEGPRVRWLQDAFNGLGYDIPTAGDAFGPITERALRDFQSKYRDENGRKLEVDGKYGHHSARALFIAHGGKKEDAV